MAITGPGPAQMMALAGRLANADTTLRRQLADRFRAAAGPAADAAKAAILSAPSHHDGTLRAEIAATVGVSVHIPATGRVTVEIVSDGSKLAGRLAGTSMNARSDDTTFRHPVFGMAEVWRDQSIAPHWFESTLIESRPAFAIAANQAIAETAQMVQGQ